MWCLCIYFLNVFESMLLRTLMYVAGRMSSTYGHITQDSLAINFHDHFTPTMWPSSSPDVNHLEYYVWEIIERASNKYPCNTFAALLQTIEAAITNVIKTHPFIVCQLFSHRLEANSFANDGDFIKWIIQCVFIHGCRKVNGAKRPIYSVGFFLSRRLFHTEIPTTPCI